MTLEAWKDSIPEDVYENLERWGSGAYLPYLIETAPRLGKIPFCLDATATYWADIILGGAYPVETQDEYGRRHLMTCQEEYCDWCDDERAYPYC
jgi:hypothetical protein